MKRQLVLGLSLFSLSASLLAAPSLCQQKQQDIQREIAMAKQHHNQHRTEGLERALAEVRDNCSDDKLKASHQQRIKEQQGKVAERERELQDERTKHDDRDKIAKRERKLEAARQELKKLQSEPY